MNSVAWTPVATTPVAEVAEIISTKRKGRSLSKTRTDCICMQRVRHKSRAVNSSASRHTLRPDSHLEPVAIPGPANGVRDGNGYSANAQSAPSETIPAIPVLIKAEGRTELGVITHLAANSQFECAGDGFSTSTMRVQCGDRYYMVFREDLERIGAVLAKSPVPRESNGSAGLPLSCYGHLQKILVDSNKSIGRELSRTEINRRKT